MTKTKKILDKTNKSNKELILSLFEQIQKETGLHIIHEVYGNCYFIFEGEDDSICHFKIKEIPGFTFAIWNANRWQRNYSYVDDVLERTDNTELIFFTQYDIHIDKFKPSRSGFCIGLERDKFLPTDKRYKNYLEINENSEWITYELEAILLYMKKHPIKSVYYVTAQNNFIWDEKPNLFLLKEFISDWCYHIKSKIKDFTKLNLTKLVTHHYLKKLDKIDLVKYLFIQQSDSWHPRLNLAITLDYDKISDKDLNLVDNILDKFNKSNFIFNNLLVEDYARIEYDTFNIKDSKFVENWLTLNENDEDYIKGEKLLRHKGV